MAVQVERLWEFMAKGLDFGAWLSEASHCARPKAPTPIFYWLPIFNPFLWALNKVWPFNPTASQLGHHSVKQPFVYSKSFEDRFTPRGWANSLCKKLEISLVIGQKVEIGPNPFTPRGQVDLVV
jgi:hypothetical protein